jgi:acetyl esterase/lipase
VCVVLALLSFVAPLNMVFVQLAVLTKEESPIFLGLTLVAIPVSITVAPPKSAQRFAMWVVLELAALVQIWPLASAHTAVQFSYSLRQAVLGDPSRAKITERHVTYPAADGSPLELILFRGTEPGPRPTMISVYGGAWQAQSAVQAIATNRHFARRGYTVVAIDYRHAPAFKHPAQINDVRKSLAMLIDSALAWGIDTSRVAFVGRSAGGHLALLAAWGPSPAATPMLRPRAVAAFYAPDDLANSYNDRPTPDTIDVRGVLRTFIGGPPDAFPAQYRDASPSTYVRPGLPPTLLVYAHHDHLVQAKFGRAMAANLRAAGDSVIYIELPWAEHGFDLLGNGIGSQVSMALLDRFLSDWLK